MNTLKKGSRGDDVKKLQELLLMSNVDGIFGPATEAHLVAWQSQHGLVADGICGPKSWAALFKEPATAITGTSLKINYQPLPSKCSKKAARSIKYLAIHYTAGASSKPGSALAVRRVFQSRQASADFAVDDAEIVQINPDPRNYYCWAVGDTKSKSSGGATVTDGLNSNTISIEICCNLRKGASAAHGNHDGWTFTEATLNNSVKLARYLMKEYNIPIGRVVRHYDISGKVCPGIIGWNDGPIIDSVTCAKTGKKNNSAKWLEFKKRLE